MSVVRIAILQRATLTTVDEGEHQRREEALHQSLKDQVDSYVAMLREAFEAGRRIVVQERGVSTEYRVGDGPWSVTTALMETEDVEINGLRYARVSQDVALEGLVAEPYTGE